jgi:hypothetical protein
MALQAQSEQVSTLMEALGKVPGCLGRQRREHPLTALLAGLVVGFAAGWSAPQIPLHFA